jgi:ferrous iron transport protein A
MDRPLKTLRPLSDLKIGEQAFIVQLNYEVEDILAKRLFELGFVPGALVEMMHRSPFHKGPMSFDIRSTQIALRYEEAQRVLCKLKSEESL